jgi:hypothetical protein
MIALLEAIQTQKDIQIGIISKLAIKNMLELFSLIFAILLKREIYMEKV